MDFQTMARTSHLPDEGCSGRVVKCNVMKVILWHSYDWGIVVILDEGNPPPTPPTVPPV